MRYCSLALVVVLLLSLFVGCQTGSHNTTGNTSTSGTVVTSTTVVSTTAATSTTDTATTTSSRTTTTTTVATTTTTTAVSYPHDEEPTVAKGEIKTINGKQWQATFVDDFDGTSLDLKKWAYCPNWVRDDCVWTNDHAYVNGDGFLILRASGDQYPYKAGAIRTKGLFEQAYGYYEIRCQLTPIAGINPAFWLMCDAAGAVGTKGGKDGAEIDIIEAPYRNRHIVQHAVHWDGYGSAHGTANKEIYKWNIYEGFHTFALEWNTDEYVFYIDGKETWRTTAGGVCAVPTYLKLTLGIGGWTGKLNAMQLPVDAMVIDYVRVYEQA